MSAVGQFGRRERRREDPALLTGAADFLADLIRPGMAALRVIRSTVAHGRIARIDCSAAASDPACIGVLTAADLPPGLGPLPAFDLVDDSAPVHQSVLAAQVVRYVGEPVAAVLAADAYVAEDLAERVVVEYEVLPPVLDAAAGIEAGAPLLYPALGSNIVHRTSQRVGDPERAFATAATIVAETFRFQRVMGSPLETRGAVAVIEEGGARYVVYSSTQIPQILRKELARITGTSLARLRVVAPRVGGGFGTKEAVYPEEVLLLLAAQKYSRCAFWIEDRQESFVASVQGREERIQLRAALDGNGVVTAVEADCLADIGAAYSLFSNTPGAAVAAVRGPYRIPHFLSLARSVVTNKPPLNVYRGAGHPQAVLAMERLMDRAAAATGLDRAEIRRRNLLQPEEFPVDRGVGYPGCGRVEFDSGNFPELLRTTLDAIDYEGFALRRARAASGVSLGLGLSFVVEMTGGGGAEPARLRLLPDGRMQLSSGITAIGQGSETTLVQILSDHLGVPAPRIEFSAGDTDELPDAPGTFASRGATMGGNAACRAGDALVARLRRLAAELRGVDIADIVWQRGVLLDSNAPHERLAPERVLQEAQARGLIASGALEATASFEDTGVGFASACHAAVLAVDRETGAVRVLDYAVTHDCGRVANPLLVDGQIMGGVLQGLGGCLYESLQCDPAGVPLTQGYMDYVLPTAATAPRFVLRHIETPSPLNPLGMKGAGEAGCSGAVGAIGTALAHALEPLVQVPGGSGPFTPSRVRELLREGRQKEASAC